jgi:hypothetical protein
MRSVFMIISRLYFDFVSEFDVIIHVIHGDLYKVFLLGALAHHT